MTHGEAAAFRRFLESVPDAMVVVDERGRITEANAQTERLFGYVRDELVGRPVEVLMPERFRDRHVGHRDVFMADPHVRPMGAGLELFALRKDGTEFPVEISLSPVQLDGARAMVAAIRDTTERKRAERKFRDLLESAPDGMVIVDGQGRIVLVNSQAERMFGYAREDLLGKRVEVLMPERFRGGHVGHRVGFMANPRMRPMGAGLELNGMRADGTEFPVEISLSPLEGEDGTLVTAAIRDVTERRKTGEAASRLAAIVESSNDAIIGKTLDGKITSWNRTAEAMFGWPADEALGRHVSFIVPDDRRPEEEAVLAHVARGGTVETIDTSRRHKDGHDVYVTVTVSPIRDAHGVIVGASSICRDVTELKRAEALRAASRAQREEIERLRQMDEMKTDFINTIAHELNTPLTPIQLQMHVLRERYANGDERAERSFEILERNFQRLAHLVRDTLEAARLQANRLRIEPRPMRILPLVQEVVASFEAQAEKAGVALALAAGRDGTVVADPARLSQVLFNLVDNAIKYTPRDGHVRVRVACADGQAVVSVEDDGLGVPPDTLRVLFQPFGRVEDPTGRRPHGTGLGLYVSRGIVEKHGGRMWCVSEGAGKGATFAFSLPLQAADATDRAPAPA